MNTKHTVAGAAGLASLTIVLAACGGSSGKAASDESSGKAAVKAVASNTQVQQAEKNAAQNIVSPCVAKATGLHPIKGFEDCIKAAVPEQDRKALEACLVKAAGADNVLTKAGRKQFENVSADQCVTAAIPGLGASPKATVTVTPAPSTVAPATTTKAAG